MGTAVRNIPAVKPWAVRRTFGRNGVSWTHVKWFEFCALIQAIRRPTNFRNFSLLHNEPHRSQYQPQLMKETRIILRLVNLLCFNLIVT